MPPRPPPDPPPQTEEEAERLPLQPWEIANLRRIEAHVGTLLSMAEGQERRVVLKAFVKRFAFATAALLAAMTLFREQLMSWISFLRGQP